MHLSFAPIRHDQPLQVARHGDVLTVNGVDFDFGPLPEGALLPREAIDSLWFAGPVERSAGVLQITLLLPHGADAPPQTLFPDPLRLEKDGPVDLPPFSLSPVQEPATSPDPNKEPEQDAD
jgi:hypothetical protein